MKSIFEKVINTGVYDLGDMVKKINAHHVEGNLTDEERTELLELARNNPDPTYSYRSWQDAAKGIVAQIDALKATVETLTVMVNSLAEGGVVEPIEPVEDDEFLPFEIRYAHNPYMKDDGMIYKGKKYRSNIDGNSWSPEAYPAGWREVTE